MEEDFNDLRKQIQDIQKIKEGATYRHLIKIIITLVVCFSMIFIVMICGFFMWLCMPVEESTQHYIEQNSSHEGSNNYVGGAIDEATEVKFLQELYKK